MSVLLWKAMIFLERQSFPLQLPAGVIYKMLLYEEGDERKKRAEICLPFKWQNHILLIGTAVLHGQMRKRQMTFIPNSPKFLVILKFMILFLGVSKLVV